MGRSRLSSAATLLVVLYLFVGAAHLHLPGFDENCPLCDASFTPVYLGLADLLAGPQDAAPQRAPRLLEVNLTLIEVASSLSFRGPPA